jgi:two-component system, NtrC family, sensor histidine kinase HydH
VGQAALFSIRVDEPASKVVDQAELPAESPWLRVIADCIQDGLVITAQPAEPGPLHVLYANPGFSVFCGLASSGTSRPPLDIAASAPPAVQDDPLGRMLQESHQSDAAFSADVVLCGENGCPTVLRVWSEPVRRPSGQITHRLALVRDVTREVGLEEMARRNERLACIGLLAAGIAHEINNPAGSAMLAAETALTLLDAPGTNQQVATCLRNIVTSMDRCGRIVRTLLRYSREEPSEKQACSINDVAKQAVELARPYAEQRGAELQLELDRDPPLLPMNPLEIELVLVNLLRNAVEASGGRAIVSIRTERTEQGARVTVRDNGCGMNREQLAHVFDPLYTTRREVGGSGLGMSIACGIIKAHAGQMEVESQPEQGTTVTIDLPAGGPIGGPPDTT